MLLFIQSIIVYGLMIWVMTYFGNIAYKRQYPQGYGGIDMSRKKMMPFITPLTKSYFLIPILVFCFFAAVRYNVGVDCEHYKSIFYDLGQFGISLSAQNIEKGFILLSKSVYGITGSHYLLLFILAFLQISLLYYAQRKNTYTLKYFGLVLILSGTFFSLMNGIRQNIVACAFVALLPLVLEKKKWLWYVLGVYLATYMHKTAFLLYPLGVVAYFLQYRIPNKYIQLGIIAVCFILMDKIQLTGIADIFSTYGADVGYDDRAIEIYSNTDAMTKAYGFRSLLLLSTYIITICYSDKMKKFFNSKIFNIQYNLFFIGICLFLLFYNDFVMNRLLYYLNIFIPLMISYCMFYLWNTKSMNSVIIFRFILLILVMHLSYELYVCMQMTPNEYSLYKFDLFRDVIL